MKAGLFSAALVAALALLVSACGSSTKTAATTTAAAAPAKPACAYRAGWQQLANRIQTAVYCPGWLPDPLTAQLHGKWNNINTVSPDKSYLESFVWQETGGGAAGGELHVNLRAYPGRTTIPTCRTGGADSQNVPCFADARGTVSANGLKATMYTVNQDADQWHVLLAWQRAGSLYTLSEHLAPPLTYGHLVEYLKHEFRSLVMIEPTSA